MKAVYNLIVDVDHRHRSDTIVIKKGDKQSRRIRATLLSNDRPLDMTNANIVTAMGVKPDLSRIYCDCSFEDKDGKHTNVVYIDLPDEAAYVAGKSTYELRMSDSQGKVLTTFEFYVEVENLLYDEDDIYGIDGLSGMRDYMTRCLQAAKRAEDLRDSFDDLYGESDKVIDSLKEQLQDYEDALDDLQTEVESGKFIGSRGPKGDKGDSGISADAGGVIAFQIEGTDLICYYYADTYKPPIYMDEEGHLIWDYGEEVNEQA